MPLQDYEAIEAAAAAATAAGLGLHTSDAALKEATASRTIQWKPEDPAALAKDLKGKEIPAIVEQVRDGTCLRCYVPSIGVMVTVLLAGAAAPRVAYGAAASGGKSDAAAPAPGSAAAKVAGGSGGGAASGQAPFALEAAFFTESRLLHRDVTLVVGGADKFHNLVGRVLVPQGDISAALLKAGLARVAAWSLPFTTPAHGASLAAAESGAKASKLRLWAGYTEPTIQGAKRFTGMVQEVVSGDCVVVKPTGAAARRIYLASVRAPRLTGRSGKDEPWAREAKEFLRKALIGRVVTVVVDYTRDPPPGSSAQEVRAHGTLTTTSRKGDPVNVSVDLVTAGLAELARHRSDDPRAACYEALLLAEGEAKEKKRGLHSGKKPSGRPPFDMSGATPAQAKEQLPFLQRGGDLTAIVDYVFSGHRFKLTVPKQNVSLIMAVSGVKCPHAPRPGQAPAPLPTAKAAAGAAAAEAAAGGAPTEGRPTGGGGGGGGRAPEPWGAEARTFALENLMQREVTVRVETLDRNGNALGHLWVGHGASKSLWACELLNLGFAQTIPAAAERSDFAAELFAAEDAAKLGRKGIWYAHDPAAAAAAAAAKAKAEGAVGDGESAFLGITVVDVQSGDSFAAHADSDLEALAAVEGALTDMKAAHGTAGGVLPSPLKRGSMIAALFDEGSGPTWFRARVNDSHMVDLPDGKKGYDLTFIDYGNSGVLPLSALRALDNVPALLTTPPVARLFRLAYVKAPGVETQWGQAAGLALSQAVMGRKLIAKVYTREAETNRLVASLFDEADPVSVNENLLRQGLVRLAKREFRAGKARAQAAASRSGPVGANAADELDFLALLSKAQEEARAGHVSMWVHGDVADSDDEPSRA